jgi:regulatory protein
MTEKMHRWGLSDDEQSQVLQRLLDGRYVDDSRYALAFVRDKVKYSKWGRRKIEQALWMKHIDEVVAQEALDSVDDEEYVEILRPMVEQKLRSTRAASDYELRMKVTKYALGRGFTMDIISRCLK